jgi:thiol-disulfide isomerase/thioredoxin
VIRDLALACALLFTACAGSGPRPSVKLPPLAGTPLDVAAQDLEGRPVRIAGAGQVVVVDFFASWCEPCREQLPRLDRLARDLGGRGLAVYGVSFDEEREAAREFAGEVGVGFPMLWDRGGDRLAPALGIERLPTTVVADRRGAVRVVHVGYTPRDHERLEAEIGRLLDER